MKKKIKKLSLSKLKIAKIECSEKVVGGGSRVFACPSIGDPFNCGANTAESCNAKCVE